MEGKMKIKVQTVLLSGLWLLALVSMAQAQLTDIINTPNTANEGIKKSYSEQIGVGRGDPNVMENSSACLITHDPFRAIARGRQLFQRKFNVAQGFGPLTNDGVGDIEADGSHGAGLVDSCAGCHGRPRGSAGFGGNVFTRPDSRDAPHLFGLGLVEQIADEITADLRNIRRAALARAASEGNPVRERLRSKGTRYGHLTAFPDGTVDISEVNGVNPDLRVRPFFAEGSTISIREFVVGALNAEMGMESFDPDLVNAQTGQVVTPSGMVLDGTTDSIEKTVATSETDDPDGDGTLHEVPVAAVDYLEFYLLNYFKPGTYKQNSKTEAGRRLFREMRCTQCHTPNMVVRKDRRVADVETQYDAANGNPFSGLFATAEALTEDRFVVRGIYADFKRHDLGPNFWERNFDGTLQKEFMTEPLWGVGSTPPYGHDGRSQNLREVILRHGGEAKNSRNRYAKSGTTNQDLIIHFLNSLVLFGPPDTPSNLNPKAPSTPDYPQFGHGSIELSVLFTDACQVTGAE